MSSSAMISLSSLGVKVAEIFLAMDKPATILNMDMPLLFFS